MPLNAQPSGGPYGPVRQSWPLPQTGGRVFYVDPDGNREAGAETIANPTTIEAAVEKVEGDRLACTSDYSSFIISQVV